MLNKLFARREIPYRGSFRDINTLNNAMCKLGIELNNKYKGAKFYVY